MLYPSDFKINARKSLRGKWLIAMLVVLVAVLPMDISDAAYRWLSDCRKEAALQALQQATELSQFARLPVGYWLFTGAALLADLLLTPVLELGKCNYFLRLSYGDDLGFRGLVSRMRSFGKALWLSLRTEVPIALGLLLLVVPGFILSANYSMAQFYLAEEPEISVEEAIRRSKKAVYGYRLTLVGLQFSFVLWGLPAVILMVFLGDRFFVPLFLFSLLTQVFVDAYRTGAEAWFYRMVSERGGTQRVVKERLERMAAEGEDQTQLHMEKEKLEKYLKDIRKVRAAKSYYDD